MPPPESTAKPLRIALVGCGSIAKTHIRALLDLPERFQLLALCDQINARAAALGAEFQIATCDFETLCANPEIDAVTLCTPTGVHAEQAVQLLEAGKHVIVEKPLDISTAACEKVIRVADANKRQLSVISQHRFDPAVEAVQRAKAAGELGEWIFIEARIPWYRSQEYYDADAWRGTWAFDGGGCLMNQGIHTIDLMLAFAGPVKRVLAERRTVAHERIEVEDLIVAIVEFESGCLGKVMASTALYPGFPAHLGLYGTKGSAVIEGDELQTLAIKGGATTRGSGSNAHARQIASGGTRSATAAVDAGQAGQWKWGDAHRAQFIDFHESIRDGRPPVVDGPSALAAVTFIKACYGSSECDAQWINLSL